MQLQVPAGAATAVGSLPHRDADEAARFSLTRLPDLPVLPTLPRRSASEGMIAQAIVGIQGVSMGPYGSLAIDARRVDPEAPVTTNLDLDAFVGFSAFLRAAEGRTAPIKWQFTGPVTLALALMRAGLSPELALPVAVRAVRGHITTIHEAVAAALPGAQQLVMLDEPSFPDVMEQDHPLSLDLAIDAVSGALAAIETTAVTGIHCCGAADWPSLIAAGPQVISMPVRGDLVKVSGYLARFLGEGGWIAWGAVPTDGPIPHTAERPWRALSKLWCELVNGGCDPIVLRTHSLVTPGCGLGLHSDAVAARVFRILEQVSHRVHSQAVATRLSIGA
jgi:hypothetical protein